MSLNAKMALEDRGSITQQGMFCLEFVWADSTYEFFFITVPVLSVEGEKKEDSVYRVVTAQICLKELRKQVSRWKREAATSA